MVKQLKSAIEIHTNNYIHPCTCPESTGMMSQSTYLLLLSVLLLHFHSISSASLLSIVERMNKEINRHLRALTFDNTSLENYPCGLGLAKGWSAEKLEVLVTRYVSKLLKAKLTTLARNVNDVA